MIYVAESPKRRILKFVLQGHTQCVDSVQLPEDAQPLFLRYHPGGIRGKVMCSEYSPARVDVYYMTSDMGKPVFELPQHYFDFVVLLTGDDVGPDFTFIGHCGGGPHSVLLGFYKKKGPVT